MKAKHHGSQQSGELSRQRHLQHQAETLFDVVLINPPFGGKEALEAQTRYEFKTNATHR